MENSIKNNLDANNKDFKAGKVREGDRQLHNNESEALKDSNRWNKSEELDLSSANNANVTSDVQQNEALATQRPDGDDQTHEASDFNQNQNQNNNRGIATLLV